MNKDRVLLIYILECIQNVHDITSNGLSATEENQHYRAALLYYLQTLAESTQKLSTELKSKHP
jgi:uncharacterized protein with HEPN domain